MYQKVIITGRLGQDPDLRYLDDGTPVCNFPVAVNRGSGDNETTTWFRVSAWRKTAENVNQYLSKGRIVTVDGELRSDPKTGGPRLYQRQDGTSGASFELNASSVTFVGGASEFGSNGGGEKEEDEIPF